MNQRKHANTIPVIKIIMMLVVAVAFGSGLLYYVFLKNRVHDRATVIKRLEKQIAEVHGQIADKKSEIALKSSRKAVQEFFMTDRSKLGMRPINTMADIRYVGDPRSEFRRAANTQAEPEPVTPMIEVPRSAENPETNLTPDSSVIETPETTVTTPDVVKGETP